MPSPLESIAAVQRVIDQNTPLGWTSKFVDPPWHGMMPGVCRGCGLDSQVAAATVKWSNSAIVKKDDRQKIIWWTCTLVCDKCGHNKRVMDRLALEAFAPLEAPVIGPEGLTPPPRGDA